VYYYATFAFFVVYLIQSKGVLSFQKTIKQPIQPNPPGSWLQSSFQTNKIKKWLAVHL